MFRLVRLLPALASIAFAVVCQLPALAAAASAVSDHVVVLEADARSHTVQHTLITDTILLTLDLPGSIIPQRVSFGGPERIIFSNAHARNPDRIALWSGSALARYRHQYGEAVTRLGPINYRLRTTSWPARLEADLDGSSADVIESVQTWVFPSNIEVTDWGLVAQDADSAPNGDWSFDDNTLVWTQRGIESGVLQIDYRIIDPSDSNAREALAGTLPEIPASLDDDDDGIPDERDVCLQSGPEADAVGCPPDTPRVLIDVTFDTGKSYLDLKARKQLDRAALAMMNISALSWEIAGFTDNQGTAARNKALSTRRAEAVRHYLLLRGVPAGRLRAQGYGENAPIGDNKSAAGRAQNRRIELRNWVVEPAIPSQ